MRRKFQEDCKDLFQRGLMFYVCIFGILEWGSLCSKGLPPSSATGFFCLKNNCLKKLCPEGTQTHILSHQKHNMGNHWSINIALYQFASIAVNRFSQRLNNKCRSSDSTCWSSTVSISYQLMWSWIRHYSLLLLHFLRSYFFDHGTDPVGFLDHQRELQQELWDYFDWHVNHWNRSWHRMS